MAKKKTRVRTTPKSLANLRDRGYKVAVVEKWNSFAHIRQDLFGMFDIVAIHEDFNGVLGVQTTTKDHINDRIKKITENDVRSVWLKAGNTIEVHGWIKRATSGKRKVWDVEIHQIIF